MSVCPSEINSMARHIDKAHGRVLVLGLGLGYYLYMSSMKPEVNSVDVVECQPEIIKLFDENLLPQFPFREKIRLFRISGVFGEMNTISALQIYGKTRSMVPGHTEKSEIRKNSWKT